MAEFVKLQFSVSTINDPTVIKNGYYYRTYLGTGNRLICCLTVVVLREYYALSESASCQLDFSINAESAEFKKVFFGTIDSTQKKKRNNSLWKNQE